MTTTVRIKFEGESRSLYLTADETDAVLRALRESGRYFGGTVVVDHFEAIEKDDERRKRGCYCEGDYYLCGGCEREQQKEQIAAREAYYERIAQGGR